MSGLSIKKRSARVSSASSVGGGSTQNVKKSLSNIKLLSANKNLKDSRSVCMDGQFCFNTGTAISFPIGSISYNMDDEKKVSFPFCLSFSLEKVWVDPKIVKSQVKVTVKKSFALDINLSAVEGKSATAKTQVIRKLFSIINGFGGTTTSSKFEEIIRSTFTSSESMEKATSLAGENNIIVNSNLKRQGLHSDRAVVIKEILMNMPKDMIITVVSEFGQIVSIKIQLVGIWQKTVVEFTDSDQTVQLASRWSFLIEKNSVHVAMAIEDHDTWASRNQFRVLLFILLVSTTAHNLGTLLEKAGGKTCIINCSLETGNRFHCAVVGFESIEKLESAFLTEPIFGGVHLSWARLNLIWCGKCGHFGHSILECDASVELSSGLPNTFKKFAFSFDHIQLARLYVKKNVPISCPAAFGRKSWAQMMSFASSSGGFSSGSGLLSGGKPLFFGSFGSQVDGLGDCLAVLEHSLEIFSDQVSVILKKLSFVDLVPLASTSCAPPAAGSVPSALVVDSGMALDDVLALPVSSSSGSDEPAAGFSSSGTKVLTSKMGGLESKLSALEALFGSILVRLDLLCSGSGLSLPFLFQ
ncbi:hypothetical protein G9A89_014762 [Geosiphon pyriformis]|nr:hypothetical protein G9A89_014762 [Geosiphon pyriformis]